MRFTAQQPALFKITNDARVSFRPALGIGPTGATGATGPSGGPFPDLTGVAAGLTPQTLGGGAVEFVDLTDSFISLAPAPTGVEATDRANIQAAIDALPNGGVVRLQRGAYKFDTTLTLHNGIIIEGESPEFGGPAVLGTSLEYAGTTSPAIAMPAIGMCLRNLSIFYSNAGFTGSLVDGTGSQHLSITDCSLAGSAVAGATQLVLLKDNTQATFTRTNFNSAVHGVRMDPTAAYSEIVRFDNCTFGHSGGGILSLSGHAIDNPNRAWSAKGCNFEASDVGYPNAVGYSSGVSFGEGLSLVGCWFGDIASNAVANTWIDFSGSQRNGLTVAGCFFEVGNTHSAIKFGKSGSAQSGCSVTGNYFYDATNPIDIGADGRFIHIAGNGYVNSTAGAELDNVFVYAVGDGSGNYTTSSTGPVDVAALFTKTIPARPGDVLDIEFNFTWQQATVGEAILVYLLVAGTARSTKVDTYTGGYSLSFSSRIQHTVTAGDITAGLVTVKPQWAVTSWNATMANAGSVLPSLSITNRRH